MRLLGLDHIVLTVKSIADSIDFYTSLGFEEVTFGEGRKALQCGSQKINLHEYGNELLPHATVPQRGSGDICIVYKGVMQEIITHLGILDIDIIEGPVSRTGAIGSIESVYIFDPDGNLVELSIY
jgi:catechol 2,3-dioxygenase-like lactoylglutathione lyase family enzyme